MNDKPRRQGDRPAPTPSQQHNNGPEGVRISKLMSERGLCSRREADAFIEQGLVYVDGVQVTELGTRARPDADITLDRKVLANIAFTDATAFKAIVAQVKSVLK